MGQGEYIVSGETDENVALYEYNCYNQLIKSNTNGVEAYYFYLPDGLRLYKYIDGEYIKYAYDNGNIIEEITEDKTNKYYRGIHLIKDSGNNYYVYDDHGNIVGIVTGDGRVDCEKEYTAFGVSEETLPVPFGYCGEYTDAESGLIYLRNRYYDPSIGRFITEDPIRDGLNWYVYCENNPIKYVDPLGLAVTMWDKQNLYKEDLKKIRENDQIWHNGTNEQKKKAQESSYNIRKKYLNPNQKLLDNGYVVEKISNNITITTAITSTKVNVTVDMVRTYKEEYTYVSLEKVEVNVSPSSGFWIEKMSISSGQSGLLSKRNTEVADVKGVNYTFLPNWGEVVDDGGVYTLIGTNINLTVRRPYGSPYNTIIFNQLYSQDVIDENGNLRTAFDGFSVLQEALMRGERN